MAKIDFVIEATVDRIAQLEQTLQDEVATVDGKIHLIFDSVKEDTAAWLLTAMVAYHGLIPATPDPSPPPINKVEELPPTIPSELQEKRAAGMSKTKKADLSIKVDAANGKGE